MFTGHALLHYMELHPHRTRQQCFCFYVCCASTVSLEAAYLQTQLSYTCLADAARQPSSQGGIPAGAGARDAC